MPCLLFVSTPRCRSTAFPSPTTIIANMARHVPPFPYGSIPPPPLPEWYRSRPPAASASSSSSTTSSSTTSESSSDDEPSAPAAHIIYTSVPLTHISVTAPSQTFPNVSPLPIYHICRVCQRPRSARYHREHPIPPNSIPPPPGICQRCRVSSARAPIVSDVIKIAESNDIRLGVRSLVSEEDCYSREELLRKRSGKEVSLRSRSSSRERGDIVYRQIKVIRRAPQRSEHASNVASANSRNPSHEKSSTVAAVRSIGDKTAQERAVPVTVQSPAREAASAKTTARDERRVVESSQTSISSVSTMNHTAERPHTSVTDSWRAQNKRQDMRTIARQELEQYDRERLNISHMLPNEADVRQIAREEIHRYRSAEQKLRTHPDPYAHGRLIPISHQLPEREEDSDDVTWVTLTSRRPVPSLPSRLADAAVEVLVSARRPTGDRRARVVQSEQSRTQGAWEHDHPWQGNRRTEDDRGVWRERDDGQLQRNFSQKSRRDAGSDASTSRRDSVLMSAQEPQKPSVPFPAPVRPRAPADRDYIYVERERESIQEEPSDRRYRRPVTRHIIESETYLHRVPSSMTQARTSQSATQSSRVSNIDSARVRFSERDASSPRPWEADYPAEDQPRQNRRPLRSPPPRRDRHARADDQQGAATSNRGVSRSRHERPLSESPSRERPHVHSRRRPDHRAPYHDPEDSLSDDVVVEDGSQKGEYLPERSGRSKRE